MPRYNYPPQSPPGSPEMDPFPKMKSEDYRLMGGINSKVSLYDNDPMQFRDISNLNFIQTGALSKRPGTTLFSGTTLPMTTGFPAVSSGYEFSKLDGQSFLVISQNGYLLQMYATFVGTPIEFNTFNNISVQPGSLFSFVTFVDRLFACDGNKFFRMAPFFGASVGPVNPLNAFMYSLPQDLNLNQSLGATFWFANMGVTGQLGTSTNGAGSTTNGLSGTYVFGYAFVNDRGFVGPPSAGVTLSSAALGGTSVVSYTIGYCSQLRNFYGVTAIQLYRSEIDGVVLTATTLAPISFSGNTTILYDVGMTLSNIAAIASNDFYLPGNGQSFLANHGSTLTYPQFIPRYLEVFNNQLFMAGFSAAPSTFFWSDIGEPEGVNPENSVEVRTNDGDILSGMKAYLGSLFISKRRSCHILTGTDPTNFLLQELSDQYGCLSHRAIVPWNNVLWFLDSKGIMQFDGANLQCVSTPIEPIFTNMNLSAAYDKSCGIHVKRFNEIWFAIPANGATINNQIVVFDYVANAWTHYDGVNAQCLFNAFAGFQNLTPFAGNYTGALVYFDPTLTSDANSGITCSLNSIFFAARGQTTENMYRRFYLNLDPVVGFTQPINLTFQTNFGTTIQLSSVMYQNPYQSRIDFGLSARSLQVSAYHYSASLPLVIRGFSVESRFQRPV